MPFYPSRHDQATYLGDVYETREAVRAHGLLSGAAAFLRLPSPNGVALQLEAGALSALTREPRLTALAVNFALFVLLQVVVFAVASDVLGGTGSAFAALGLLLTAASPYFWAGGLFDFRLDLAAFCLFGVFVALAVRSRMFEATGLSVAAGAAAGALVLHRFIAVVYVGAILAIVFLVFLVSGGAGKRLRGVVLCSVTAAALAAPALFANLPSLRAYYLVNHVLGGEKSVRAAEQGIRSRLAALTFYPRSVLFHHLGPLFVVASILLLAASVASRRKSGAPSFALPKTSALFFATTLFVLYGVFTADEAKSPVVGGVFVPAVLWLVLVLAFPKGSAPSLSRPVVAFVFVAGVAFTAGHLLNPPVPKDRAELAEITRLHDDAFDACRKIGTTTPAVAIDRIDDAFDARVFRVFAYERHGVLLGPTTALGDVLFDGNESETLSRLRASDLLVVTLDAPPTRSAFPFDRAMERFAPSVRSFCAANRTLAGRYRFHGREVALYVLYPTSRPSRDER